MTRDLIPEAALPWIARMTASEARDHVALVRAHHEAARALRTSEGMAAWLNQRPDLLARPGLRVLAAGRVLFPWIRYCSDAIGLGLEEPPMALAEVEHGLARIEELFCRLMETMPDSAFMAGEIRRRGRGHPAEDDSGSPYINDVFDAPSELRWVRIIIIGLLDETEARIREASGHEPAELSPDQCASYSALCPPAPRTVPHLAGSAGMVSPYALVALTDEELAHRGVDPALRLVVTGHERRLNSKWCSTIGMWGGVKTLREIAEVAGVTARTAGSYQSKIDANPRGKVRLRTRTDTYRRQQSTLIAEVGAWLRYEVRGASPTAEQFHELEQRLGILRIESRLYFDVWHRVQAILQAASPGEEYEDGDNVSDEDDDDAVAFRRRHRPLIEQVMNVADIRIELPSELRRPTLQTDED